MHKQKHSTHTVDLYPQMTKTGVPRVLHYLSSSSPPSLPHHFSSIQGFMQKADAEKMLLQCASGTFLIRFSEGEPGGISVAWVTGETVMYFPLVNLFCFTIDFYIYDVLLFILLLNLLHFVYFHPTFRGRHGEWRETSVESSTLEQTRSVNEEFC